MPIPAPPSLRCALDRGRKTCCCAALNCPISQVDVTVEEDERRCNPPVCSGHGACEAYVVLPPGVDKTTGHCACADGYVGAACDKPCPSADGGLCNGRGTCRLSELGQAECVCHSSASEGHWGGANCAECAEGWLGADCKKECPGCGADGVCNPEWASEADPLCACSPGYYGETCGYAGVGEGSDALERPYTSEEPPPPPSAGRPPPPSRHNQS